MSSHGSLPATSAQTPTLATSPRSAHRPRTTISHHSLAGWRGSVASWSKAHGAGRRTVGASRRQPITPQKCTWRFVYQPECARSKSHGGLVFGDGRDMEPYRTVRFVRPENTVHSFGGTVQHPKRSARRARLFLSLCDSSSRRSPLSARWAGLLRHGSARQLRSNPPSARFLGASDTARPRRSSGRAAGRRGGAIIRNGKVSDGFRWVAIFGQAAVGARLHAAFPDGI